MSFSFYPDFQQLLSDCNTTGKTILFMFSSSPNLILDNLKRKVAEEKIKLYHLEDPVSTVFQ